MIAHATLMLALASLPPGDSTHTIDINGVSRTYHVHIPADLPTGQRVPLIVALHPFATTGQLMKLISGLDALADREHLVVVYPEGTGPPILRSWNAGGFDQNKVDDVGFLRRLIEHLLTDAPIDPKRVYATGMSNGAMMCYRLASELSDVIAAIAPVAGTQAFEGPIQAKRPVPVLHIHGTADNLVHYEARPENRIRFSRLPGVEETVRRWAAFDGCPMEPRSDELPDKADDGTRVTLLTWGPGRQQAEVLLYKVEGGGHTWPGSRTAADFLGRTCRDSDANALIWAFFARHPMP